MAETYRRRKFPNYLLSKFNMSHPNYISNSSLSLAYAKPDNTMTLIITLDDYREQFITSEHFNRHFKEMKTLQIELQVQLVTSSEELLKQLIRSVYKQFGVVLKPKISDNLFCLQVSGFEEFLTGDHPLMNYDRVRLLMRDYENLKLNLIEMDNSQQTNFPPIFIRHSNDESIDWQQFKDVPILFWYPPEPLEQIQEMINNQTNNNLSQMYQSDKKLNQQEIEQIVQRVQRRKNKKQQLDKFRCQEKNLLKKYIHLKESQQRVSSEYPWNFIDHHNNKNDSNIQLESGECDWPFTVDLLSIENFVELFKHIDTSEDLEQLREREYDILPNYNGLTNPIYITKEPMITQERRKKQKKNRQRSLTPKIIKTVQKQRKVSVWNPYKHQHITHGKKGNIQLQQFANKYDLGMIPYLIYIEIGIYIGDQCLRKQRMQEKDKIGFNLQPIFNQTVEFSDGIMISQLPLESRLVIEIYIQSQEGFYQCIAFGQLQLFDEFGVIKQGVQGINLWPFYRKEVRMSCTDQYWVNRYKLQCDQQDIKQHGNYVKYFSILYLKLETFNQQMKYTVRNSHLNSKKYSQLINEDINLTYFQQKAQQSKSNQSRSSFQYNTKKHSNPSTEQLIQLTNLLTKDPMSLSFLTTQEKEILYISRNHYKTQPKKLIHFLRSLDFSDPDHIIEAQHMTQVWAPLRPEEALPLLDSWMADEAIRQFSVSILQQWRDDELALFLPQLTQSLQFESQHYTLLIEFLLERSLKQPFVIGHELFWYLKSQLFLKPSYEKFSLILEQFLMLCGSFIQLLVQEHELQDKVTMIAQEAKLASNPRNILQQKLKENFNNNKFGYKKYCFAIDPRQMIKSFDIDKCITMKSKKIPLKLTCNNYQPKGNKIEYLFKTGDDLRQDILTLQLIRIMNKIWLDNGYDLKMSPYKVTSTWDQTGIIELVQGETLEKIQCQNMAGFNVFTDHIIKQNNPKVNKTSSIFPRMEDNSVVENEDPIDKEKQKRRLLLAFDNYTKSTAAYCVATYILGIGDRHPGNIMLQNSGKLFHIDFGHFLGHFKKKFGINRERTAFVYTKEMHNAITYMDQINPKEKDSNFNRFQKLCGESYNLIRKNSDLIINVFMMMISAGMPELQRPQDIKYTVDKLNISLSEDEARQLFMMEIEKSRNDLMRRFDNLVHNVKHKGPLKVIYGLFGLKLNEKTKNKKQEEEEEEQKQYEQFQQEQEEQEYQY